MTPAELARELAKLFPTVARSILAQLIAWRKSASRASLNSLVVAIEGGDEVAAARLLVGDAVALAAADVALPNAADAFTLAAAQKISRATTTTERALVRTVSSAVVEAGQQAARAVPARLEVTLHMPTTPRVVQDVQRTVAAANYGEDALRYLRHEAHAGVRAAVQHGNANGINPRVIAKDLRALVGLGETQTLWVMNLQNELETQQYGKALARQLVKGPMARTIEKRQRTRTPFTKQEIDSIVTKYAEKWTAWHAETIARTMSLDLLRHGSIVRVREAIDAGMYAGSPVIKEWVTTMDGRERDAHRDLNGEKIDINAQWNDDGELRDVPGGWNCRCSIFYRVGIRRGL